MKQSYLLHYVWIWLLTNFKRGEGDYQLFFFKYSFRSFFCALSMSRSQFSKQILCDDEHWKTWESHWFHNKLRMYYFLAVLSWLCVCEKCVYRAPLRTIFCRDKGPFIYSYLQYHVWQLFQSYSKQNRQTNSFLIYNIRKDSS